MTSILSNAALWNWTSPVWLAVVPTVIAVLRLQGAKWSYRLWWLIAAMIVLLTAFVSPIGGLADGYLFGAHIVQHLLLLLIVPMFLLLSLPKEAFSGFLDRPGFWGLKSLLSTPAFCWVCGLGVMWLWHIPSLCSAATQNNALGIVRSVSFLLAGLAFWWPIYAPIEKSRLNPMSAAVYLFSACLGCTLLGIYVTFTTVAVCPVFANPADRIGIMTSLYNAGLTPAIDQQLGGLLMWVPPCSLYVAAIISVLCRWYSIDLNHTSKSTKLTEAAV